jgi:hypothetical protein
MTNGRESRVSIDQSPEAIKAEIDSISNRVVLLGLKDNETIYPIKIDKWGEGSIHCSDTRINGELTEQRYVFNMGRYSERGSVRFMTITCCKDGTNNVSLGFFTIYKTALERAKGFLSKLESK